MRSGTRNSKITEEPPWHKESNHKHRQDNDLWLIAMGLVIVSKVASLIIIGYLYFRDENSLTVGSTSLTGLFQTNSGNEDGSNSAIFFSDGHGDADETTEEDADDQVDIDAGLLNEDAGEGGTDPEEELSSDDDDWDEDTTENYVPPNGDSGMSGTSSEPDSVCTENGGSWISIFLECEGLDEDICVANGGEYEACASACRDFPQEDGEECQDSCVEVCRF